MKSDASPAKGKKAASLNETNTNMHKLRKMGLDTTFKVSGGKKTPA